MSPRPWPKAVPLLVLAGLCAYANCYPKTLVFDDDAWIVDQPKLDSPAEYFKEMDGRPLLAATNLVLHRAGRNNPLPHHVFNVLVHLAATLTLYGVVRRALLSRRFADRFADRASYLAFAVALLWMLHPLQVQCVTYVIQRGESMAGLFYLLILYGMLRGEAAAGPRPSEVRFEPEEADYAEPGTRPSERWSGVNWRTVPWYALALVSLALGFGAKEIMVTAPGPILLFDRIFLSPSLREMVRRRWLFHLLFLLVWGGFTYWHFQRAAEAAGGLGFRVEAVKPTEYALTQTGVILYYLRVSVWPRGLAIDYQSWPWTKTAAEAMPELAIVLGLLAVTAVLVFWRPAVGFVAAWFFLILIPTSSFMPIVDAVFEHRMYLSLASVSVGVVFAADGLLRRTRLGWLRPVALAAAAAALGVLTHVRNEEYRSRASVWTAAMERMPDSVRARANLAQGLLIENRAEEVIPVLERALELSPTDPTAIQNLAATYEQLGEYASAAEYYGRLKAYYPAVWKHWRMWADTLLVLQRWEEAAEAYTQAAELNRKAGDGESPQPHYARAVALRALGREAEAEAEIRAATALTPDWPEGVLNTARTVVLEERLRDNVLARQSALNWVKLGLPYIDKPHPQVLDTAGLCYAAAGDFAKAMELSRWALVTQPGGPWGSLHRDRLRCYGQKRVPWE
jgi:protein O-mannosyl-transferase